MIARCALLGVLAGLVAVTPALGLELSGNTFTLTDDERAACREEGGCSLVTTEYVRKMLEDERKAGRASCGRST